MNTSDSRPGVWVGHIAMHSKEVPKTCQFMQLIGMRLVMENQGFALLELRGGTHLVITDNAESDLIKGSFDLMVDDIDDAHRQFTDLGLSPSKIERGEIHDSFNICEPGGTVILFNSSHVGDLPV